MSGFLFAFAAAFFASTSDALCKRALQKHDAILVAWVRLAFAVPFLVPLLFFIPAGDFPDKTFWMILVLLFPLEILAITLYMRALKISPMSLTVPFLALTPVFTLLTSLVLLGEFPDRSGVAGILLIVLGAYLLGTQPEQSGWLAPLKAISREKGILLMSTVAFIYSITANLGKIAVSHSSPVFLAAVYFPLLSVVFYPVGRRAGFRPSDLTVGAWLFVAIGLSQAAMALCHFKAISMILVPYMISVKRLSLLLSVVYGGMFFHETQIRQRLFGSSLMIAGVCLVLL